MVAKVHKSQTSQNEILEDFVNYFSEILEVDAKEIDESMTLLELQKRFDIDTSYFTCVRDYLSKKYSLDREKLEERFWEIFREGRHTLNDVVREIYDSIL